MPEIELRKSYLYLVDLDNDSHLDLVVCFPQAGKLLSVARGKGDGTFDEIVTLASPVRISDRAQIQFHDVDSNLFIDILINDLERGGILLLANRGEHSFDNPLLLVSGSEISHYAVGDLNEDGIPDLGITLRSTGRLQLYDGRIVFTGMRN